MRVFITGGGGFIGRRVVARLIDRGDQVVAVVRDPARYVELQGKGVQLVAGDLSGVDELRTQIAGSDAVVHLAGMYRIGIRPSERPAMLDANLGATERVLDAAAAVGPTRVVYVSTNNVHGNTHGEIVDESHRRDLGEGFLSWYDETKYRAHEAAERRIARGDPIVIAQPGGVYGKGDHSEAGAQLKRAHDGALPYLALGDAGLAWVHVDDVAQGIVAVLDRGRIGQTYSLAGPCLRLREALALAARVGGHRPPRLEVPTRLLRSIVPLADRLGGLPGLPANLSEVLRASDGVTYWANHDKATRELGFAARDLETGVRDAFGPG